MFAWLLAAMALIRAVPSATVPGIIDLQRPTEHGWQTYNNISLLVEADGVWNSAELNGGDVIPIDGGFLYGDLDNGARVRVDIRVTGLREITATASVLKGNVTKIALSNDYGLATRVRYVTSGTEVYDALRFPEPRDGPGVPGDFYPISVGTLVLIGDVVQYQRAPGAVEAFIEVRRQPWLTLHVDPGRNWIERVHLTRSGGGEWTFGYSSHSVRTPY